MCDTDHFHTDGFGYLVDTPEIRALIEETERLRRTIPSDADRVDALRPAFAKLLAADGWLPDSCARPDERSRMGGGIAQYALYRAHDGSLCLFSLVVPAAAATPVHDHLAWGLVGLYRGTQDEEIFEGDPIALRERRSLVPGDFYALLPPADDIHRVRTTSAETSVSIHLLTNDTGCIWRHAYDADSGAVSPFRSGYVNVLCDDR